jgi:predicted SpoU family rRNA methylase
MKRYLNYADAIKAVGETAERSVMVGIEDVVDSISDITENYGLSTFFVIEDDNEWTGVRVVDEAGKKYSFEVFGAPKNKMSMALRYLGKAPFLDAD